METKSQVQTPLVSFVIAYYEVPVKLLQECLDAHLGSSLKGRFAGKASHTHHDVGLKVAQY